MFFSYLVVFNLESSLVFTKTLCSKSKLNCIVAANSGLPAGQFLWIHGCP